jgi:hypothetical protein
VDEFGGDRGTQLMGRERLRIERDRREAALGSMRNDVEDGGDTLPDDGEESTVDGHGASFCGFARYARREMIPDRPDPVG